eukprot:evm.model.NODE_19488_length_45021_cov_26.593590.2
MSQVELDSIAQQVAEIETAVLNRRATVAPASVLEGLSALSGNLQSIAAQIDAHSHDHTESGQGEALALGQRIRSTAQAVGERIAQMRNELNSATAGSGEGEEGGGGGAVISRQVAVNGLLGSEPTPPPTLVNGPALGLNPVLFSSSLTLPQPGLRLLQYNGSSTSATEIGRMDTSSEGSMGSSSFQHSNSLSSNGGEEGAVMPSDTVLYSWGRTDLGASFQERGKGLLLQLHGLISSSSSRVRGQRARGLKPAVVEEVADLLGEVRGFLGEQPKKEDGLLLAFCLEEIVAESKAAISSYHSQMGSIDSRKSASKTKKGGGRGSSTGEGTAGQACSTAAGDGDGGASGEEEEEEEEEEGEEEEIEDEEEEGEDEGDGRAGTSRGKRRSDRPEAGPASKRR